MSPYTILSINAKLDSGVSKTYIHREDNKIFSDIINIPISLAGLRDKTISEINQKVHLPYIEISLQPHKQAMS